MAERWESGDGVVSVRVAIRGRGEQAGAIAHYQDASKRPVGGFGQLEVKSNDGNGTVSPADAAAAGYAEGVLTAHRIEQQARNVFASLEASMDFRCAP